MSDKKSSTSDELDSETPGLSLSASEPVLNSACNNLGTEARLAALHHWCASNGLNASLFGLAPGDFNGVRGVGFDAGLLQKIEKSKHSSSSTDKKERSSSKRSSSHETSSSSSSRPIGSKRSGKSSRHGVSQLPSLGTTERGSESESLCVLQSDYPLICVPHPLFMSPMNVLVTAPTVAGAVRVAADIGSPFEAEDVLVLFLVELSRCLRSLSTPDLATCLSVSSTWNWLPYACVLPQTYSTPLWWDPASLAHLQSAAFVSAEELAALAAEGIVLAAGLERVNGVLNTIKSRLARATAPPSSPPSATTSSPHLVPRSVALLLAASPLLQSPLSFEEYRWATSVIGTRSVYAPPLIPPALPVARKRALATLASCFQQPTSRDKVSFSTSSSTHPADEESTTRTTKITTHFPLPFWRAWIECGAVSSTSTTPVDQTWSANPSQVLSDLVSYAFSPAPEFPSLDVLFAVPPSPRQRTASRNRLLRTALLAAAATSSGDSGHPATATDLTTAATSEWVVGGAHSGSRGDAVRTSGIEEKAARRDGDCALVPFFDLLNHSDLVSCRVAWAPAPATTSLSSTSTSTTTSSSSFSSSTPLSSPQSMEDLTHLPPYELVLEQGSYFPPSPALLASLSSANLTASNEVFISYGPLSSLKLIQRYGFAIRGNVHDAVCIDLLYIEHLLASKHFASISSVSSASSVPLAPRVFRPSASVARPGGGVVTKPTRTIAPESSTIKYVPEPLQERNMEEGKHDSPNDSATETIGTNEGDAENGSRGSSVPTMDATSRALLELARPSLAWTSLLSPSFCNGGETASLRIPAFHVALLQACGLFSLRKSHSFEV